MAECDMVTLPDDDQVSDYFIEMEKHHSNRAIQYNEMSVWIINKLNAQNKFFNKIMNIRHRYRVNRVFEHIKHNCAIMNDVERTTVDYTVQNIMSLYIHVKSPWIKSTIKYYIESVNLCNGALLNAHDKYPDDFIDSILDKTPTYHWECKMKKALHLVSPIFPNYRIITLKEYKEECLSHIKYSIEYRAFIGALESEENLIKDLILLFLKARDEFLKR